MALFKKKPEKQLFRNRNGKVREQSQMSTEDIKVRPSYNCDLHSLEHVKVRNHRSDTFVVLIMYPLFGFSECKYYNTVVEKLIKSYTTEPIEIEYESHLFEHAKKVICTRQEMLEITSCLYDIQRYEVSSSPDNMYVHYEVIGQLKETAATVFEEPKRKVIEESIQKVQKHKTNVFHFIKKSVEHLFSWLTTADKAVQV